MKLSVNLVTWNGAKYVPYLFNSLRKQIYQDWELVILDNASTDGMIAAMEKEIAQFPVPVRFIKSETNTGFAGGHNRVFKETSAPYLLLLNQDMVLAPDCLVKLTSFLETHAGVAAVAPRHMKWEFPNGFTDQIDALGLKVFRNRRVIEKYTGKFWAEIKPKMHLSFRAERFVGDTALEVFGISGSLPLFRRSALQEIAFPDGTFFDESYHSYKEDVDVAFRLRSAGYTAYTLLDTVVFHDRSAAGPREIGDFAASDNKKKQSSWVKYHSYKNHLATLYKNEYGKNFLLDFPFIFWYELKKFLWLMAFEPHVLKGLIELFKNRKELKAKRQHIVARRKISFKEMRAWWTT